MLLFKNGLRKLLKDYVQFGIYLVLITIAVIFTSSFGIVSSNLIRTNNEINRNFEKFDYSFRYTSSSYKANDTQTFTPWFAFNTELIKDNENNSYTRLSFGETEEKGALKPYEFNFEDKKNYHSSLFTYGGATYLNFHFGDIESDYGNKSSKLDPFLPKGDEIVTRYSIEQKIEVVKKAEFGDFYRFNTKSKYFKTSLIGQLYEKNNYFNDEKLNEKQIKTAINIFDYMFYLNNSMITNKVKSDILSISNEGQDPVNINTFLEKGIGNIEGDKYYFTKSIDDFDKKILDNSELNLFKNNASFYIKKFDMETIFQSKFNKEGYVIQKNTITAREMYDTYFDLLGDLSNFDVRTTNEAVKWDSGGKKYRYISAFYNTRSENSDNLDAHFYNEDIFHFYKKNNSLNSLTENSFIVSSGYAKFNKMQMGKNYEIFNNGIGYQMDGIGVDSLNVYPTIYEEDLLTNQENEAIFYISNEAFRRSFNKEDESSYQDVSRAYLTYTKKDKSNINQDILKLQTYFADDALNLGVIQENIINQNFNGNSSRAKIESYEETTLLNMRSSLFPGFVKGFLGLAIIFCAIFVVSLAFVVYNIFRKVLISQRSQIGNLKSLGVSNIKIVINYVLYMVTPVFLIVPIGWTISLFLQGSLMGIFERYFNINSMLSIDWKLLFVEWISFTLIVCSMVFVTAYMTVRQSPLALLSPSKSNKPNLILLKQLNKIKVKNFTSKLRLVILSSALKDMIIFFGILLVSSSVITLASTMPNTMKNMTKEYYRNMKYNNDFSYSGVVTNNPLSRYSFYNVDENNKKESNLEASLFNATIKEGDNFKNLLDYKDWKSTDNYAKYFEEILTNNILTFNGGLISVGIMDELVKIEKKVNNKTVVQNDLDNFGCKVLPKLFGQSSVSDETSYKSCIKVISNNVLPSTIKEMWDKDENEFLNFSFNFSNIPVDRVLDQMYTTFNSTISNSQNFKLQTYGIDLNSNAENLIIKNKNLIAYNDNLDYIPVLINKKDKLDGMKIGDTFSLDIPTNLLSVLNSNNKYVEIKSSDWSYEGHDLNSMDLDKFTYSLDDNIYYNTNEGYKKYNNMADIELKINKNSIDKELFDKVNEKYKEYSNIKEDPFKESDKYYIIKPFDIYVYDDKGDRESFDQFSLMNGTNSWLNIALDEGLLSNSLFEMKSYKKLKVVGVEELYDGNKIYMDQLYANRLIGIGEGFDNRKYFSDGSSVNIWSNAKMSSNSQNADQMQRILFKSFNANNTIAGFSKYMDQAIGYTDYIQMKKMAMENLITSVISISVIFVSLSMITAIIIIYLITDMFIGRYKRFMSYMRIQGYSMKEINSILIWVFLPVAIAAVFIGIFLVWSLIMFLLPQVLISIDIAVPMIMGWTIMPLIFVEGISIFLLGYFIIMMSIRRVKLASLIGNE